MKITSWNVNWIRAVIQKDFFWWIQKDNPDILCLQEVKAFENQLPAEFKYMMKDYNRIWHAGEKPGYSWTAIFYKKTLDVVWSVSRFEEVEYFHTDGRVVELSFGDFVLLNIYFPNGWEKADGTEMLTYKLEFYHKFLEYIDKLKSQGKKVITTWDFNICHREIDIARPKENINSIWFLPIERAEMDRLIEHGYVDVFRHFNPELTDHYTRWSYRAWARPRNVWRRLDYFRVSGDVIPLVQRVIHQTAVEGSDHCPISLEVNI